MITVAVADDELRTVSDAVAAHMMMLGYWCHLSDNPYYTKRDEDGRKWYHDKAPNGIYWAPKIGTVSSWSACRRLLDEVIAIHAKADGVTA